MTGEIKPTVLITGGSGLIGKYLTSALLTAGYGVSHLSRGQDQFGRVRVYRWDPGKGILDTKPFQGVEHIVHLAGANIGERPWTKSRKDEILCSRTDSAKLLHKVVSGYGIKIKSFISASGVSCYGTITSDQIFTEDDPFAYDFLGNVCRQWEEAAGLFEKDGVRTVKIRAAVALEKSDIAMKRMSAPAKVGFIGMAGSGKQYMPWIHITDLVGIYLKAVTDESMKGVYNAVSPQHVTHRQFMKALADTLGRPLMPIPAPAFTLKVVYGEMASIVLEGSRVSSEKIQRAGFNFEYGNLNSALENIFV